MEENKNKNKKILDWIIKIILIIIIIFLLLHNCELIKDKKDYENSPKPSGNVDIIEIKCDREDTCEVVPKEDNSGSANTASTIKNNEEQVPLEFDDKLTVYDNNITWNGEVETKIFTNSMYNLEDVIAPESSNTYQFVVKNSTRYNLKYNIEFIETNPYNINMKYKLKKNDTYLIDHYVSASELDISNILLNINNNDTYYLEWKWVSSDNDTEVGKTGNANYGLKILIKAEDTNG